MITIQSQPQALNYSESLPPIVFTSDQPEVTVTLLDGTTEIMAESYTPMNADTPIALKFGALIDDLLRIALPGADVVTLHDQGVRTYTVRISDTTASEDVTFRVIKGLYYRQPLDLDMFTATNWLSIGSFQSVTTHQPVYLSALSAEAITVQVACLFTDGSTDTVSHAALVANKLQTVDVSPYLIQQYFADKAVLQYNVTGLSATGTKLLRDRLFTVSQNNPLTQDIFVFQNRLGGFDSLIMSGQQTDTFKNDPSTALMDEYTVEYAAQPTRSIKKNTGYIGSHAHRQQLIDFIFSTQRYHLHDGALRRITLKDPSLDFLKNNVNESDIEFSYSDTLLVYPQIEQVPNYLNISQS